MSNATYIDEGKYAVQQWKEVANKGQLEPEGDGHWFIRGERATGKTRTLIETANMWAVENPQSRGVFVVPDNISLQLVMDGNCGFLKPGYPITYNKVKQEVKWSNGSTMRLVAVSSESSNLHALRGTSYDWGLLDDVHLYPRGDTAKSWTQDVGLIISLFIDRLCPKLAMTIYGGDIIPSWLTDGKKIKQSQLISPTVEYGDAYSSIKRQLDADFRAKHGGFSEADLLFSSAYGVARRDYVTIQDLQKMIDLLAHRGAQIAWERDVLISRMNKDNK